VVGLGHPDDTSVLDGMHFNAGLTAGAGGYHVMVSLRTARARRMPRFSP
jgi:hypothetical protein